MSILAATKLEAVRQLAELYQVDQRTIYRWQRMGVNLASPCDVMIHLANQKTPSPAAVQAVKSLLKTELNS